MTVHALPERAGARPLNEREAAPSVLTLAVENMRCGGCIRSVERAAMSVPGVVGARANLGAKRVSVTVEEGGASEADVIAALGQAGFAAAPMRTAKGDAETRRESELLRRVAVSGFAAMNIMLLSVSVWAGRAGDMDQSLVTLFCWLSALIALPTVVYAGLGNIAAALAAPNGQLRRMVSLNGTAGHNARRIQSFEYPCGEGLLIMHTDGIASSWTLDPYPGFIRLHPMLLAGLLMRDHSRGRDDATVDEHT